MKKIFKALSVLVAGTALCAGAVFASACSGYNGVYTGEYSYTNAYGATYGMRVEVTVENNIITKITDITNTEDSLKTQGGWVQDWAQGGKYVWKDSDVEWDVVSVGWETYYEANLSWLLGYDFLKDDSGNYLDEEGNITTDEDEYVPVRTLNDGTVWDPAELPEPYQTNVYSYAWTNSNSSNWSNHEAWLLQQYVGWSVADVLDINVYYAYGYVANSDGSGMVESNSVKGEPYATSGGYNDELQASGLLVSGSTQGSGRLILAVQNALGK